MIYRTLHECSATAQTILTLLFKFILCLLSFHLREGRMLLNTTLNKLILLIGYTSNDLASLRKSALIQKPSAQIPKDFNQLGITEKTKKYEV